MALTVATSMLCQVSAKNTFVPKFEEDEESPFEDETVFGGLQAHKPGLKLRLA